METTKVTLSYNYLLSTHLSKIITFTMKGTVNHSYLSKDVVSLTENPLCISIWSYKQFQSPYVNISTKGPEVGIV